MSRVLVSGSIAYDRIMDFPGLFSEHFVADKLHNLSVSFQVDTFKESFGGCAGNVAYNLALLGEEPVILSTGGNDFEAYAGHLQEAGIDPTSVRIDAKDKTAAAYVMTDRGDNQIAAFYFGAGRKPYGTSKHDAALAIITPGNLDDMHDLAPHYREEGIKYMFDPGQQLTSLTQEQLRDIVAGASALLCNDYELGLIEKKLSVTEKELLELVPTIVATLGAQGANILTKKGKETVGAVRVANAVDPTGAGDAHRAGFVKGILEGLPLKQCAQLGAAVASYAVENYGTQAHRFTMDDLRERYEGAFEDEWQL